MPEKTNNTFPAPEKPDSDLDSALENADAKKINVEQETSKRIFQADEDIPNAEDEDISAFGGDLFAQIEENNERGGNKVDVGENENDAREEGAKTTEQAKRTDEYIASKNESNESKVVSKLNESEELKGLSEKEKRKFVERKKLDILLEKDIQEDETTEFASEITDNEEDARKVKVKTDKSIEQFATENDETGMTGFLIEVGKAIDAKDKGDDSVLDELNRKLIDAGLKENEAKALIDRYKEKRKRNEIKDKYETQKIFGGYEEVDKKHGTNLAEEAKDRYAQTAAGEGGVKKAQEELKENFAEDAKKYDELKKIKESLDDFDRAWNGNEVEEQETPKKTRSELKEELLESVEAGENYAELPPEAQASLESVMEEGGTTTLVRELLSGGYDVDEYGVYGTVDGAIAHIDFATSTLTIVGEHAATRLNKLSYSVTPPTISNFNQRRIHMIAQQNRMGFLAANQDTLNSFAAGIGMENPESDTLYGNNNAILLHNVMFSMFGADEKEASEERKLLFDLNIIRGESNEVDPSQLSRFRRAFIKYVPDINLRMFKKNEKSEIDDHLVTLAKLWEIDPYRLPSLGRLKTITEKIDKGGYFDKKSGETIT